MIRFLICVAGLTLLITVTGCKSPRLLKTAIHGDLATMQVSGRYQRIENSITTAEPVVLLVRKQTHRATSTSAPTHDYRAYFRPEGLSEVRIRYSVPTVEFETLAYVHVQGTHPAVRTKRLVAANPASEYIVRVFLDPRGVEAEWVINIGGGNVQVWAPITTYGTFDSTYPTYLPNNHYLEVRGNPGNIAITPSPFTPAVQAFVEQVLNESPLADG